MLKQLLTGKGSGFVSRQTYFCQPAPSGFGELLYYNTKFNFLISKRWQHLLQRFAMRTECDHIWKVTELWRVCDRHSMILSFLPALLPPLLSKSICEVNRLKTLKKKSYYKLLPFLKVVFRLFSWKSSKELQLSLRNLLVLNLSTLDFSQPHQAILITIYTDKCKDF